MSLYLLILLGKRPKLHGSKLSIHFLLLIKVNLLFLIKVDLIFLIVLTFPNKGFGGNL